MKNLREIRKEKGMTLIGVSRQLGLTNVCLHEYELGKHSPGIEWRHLLENFYGTKINWLDIPINMSPRPYEVSWYDCERNFRWDVHQIASMPKDEKNVFIETIIKQLNKLKDEK
jgi:transcriptional regulator with XRE-family HTH domain